MRSNVPHARVRRTSFAALLLAILSLPVLAQEKEAPPVSQPEGVTGTVRKHAQFTSRYVASRDVDVWLPPSYDRDKKKRYPVVYMHDGQNLFDPKTSYTGVDWGVDEAMTRLIREGNIREAIIVGVWNTPRRVAEYMPRKAVTSGDVADVKNTSDQPSGPIVSDEYLAFLVLELKPFVDATYRTLPDAKNTSVMGSSMGGLISAYAICEYPQIFGAAGCVSTHWPAGDGAVVDYLKRSLPDPKTHRFYFDFGTATLDESYEPYQIKANSVMIGGGYRDGKNWVTRKFAGADHSEKSWRERVGIPLAFLVGK